jgi:hypothetical protein
MNRTNLLLLFLALSSLVYGQKIDTTNYRIENLKSVKLELLRKGERLIYLQNMDTVLSYLAINRKIVKANNSIFYLMWNSGEQIVEEKNGAKMLFTSPFVAYYNDFIDIPKSWDVTNNFWSLDAIELKTRGGSPFCTGVEGDLKRVPLKDIGSWTGNLFSKKVPKYDLYDVTQSLPINKVFYETYFERQLEKKKKEEEVITYLDVENLVVKETFFDFFVTAKQNSLYVLYHDKQLLMWQLNEKTTQWEKKLSLPFSTNGFFTCFEFKNKLYLIDFEGVVYRIKEKTIKKVKILPEKLINIALVIDKDAGTIGYIKQTDISESSLMTKVISEKTINIFK